MRYSAEWQDDATNLAPEERATVADLRLWLDQQNICLHLQGTKSVDHITVPLYALTEGLAHDWWTLFRGRDNFLSFFRYRSGYAIPDVRMAYDGAAFEISSEQRIYTNPDIRFWAGSSQVMTRPDAEAQLSEFIEFVLGRLEAKGVAPTSAVLRWARVKASREDVAEASFCEAAGALRLDPYNIDESAAHSIEQSSELFEGEPLTEFLGGARPKNCLRLVDWVKKVEGRASNKSRVGELQSAAVAVAGQVPDRPGEASWARGYRRARALRRQLGFDQTRRFETFLRLAQAIGASTQFDLAPPIDGIRLLRSHHGDDAHLHLRTHGRSAEAEASHLFSIARGIGDVVCFPVPQRAPVNELRSAYRQAAGRAFAAEFLAPVNEILSMQDDGRDNVAIAEEFNVSTEVIERQIENAQRIEGACR